MFGRVRRGWGLTKKAWAVIRSHPGLARLPLTGGILALLAVAVLGIPGALLVGSDSTGAVIGGIVVLAIAAYLASFTVIYFNVTLAAADQVMGGGEPDLSAARGVARSRAGKIAAWALVSAGVSAVLGALRGRGGVAGSLGAAIGAEIWSLVTFLVVPVLAFEGIGPFAAMKRSAALFRRHWGPQVTGDLVIGGLSGLIVLAGIVISAVGVALLAGGGPAAEVVAGGLLIVAGVTAWVGAAVFGGATRGVFGVALYRYVAEDLRSGRSRRQISTPPRAPGNQQIGPRHRSRATGTTPPVALLAAWQIPLQVRWPVRQTVCLRIVALAANVLICRDPRLWCRRSPGGRLSHVNRRRTSCTYAALPNLAVFDQGGAYGAAGPAPAAGSALGRPARRTPGHVVAGRADRATHLASCIDGCGCISRPVSSRSLPTRYCPARVPGHPP
jgi:hypothetical protein